jgi:exonuclease III
MARPLSPATLEELEWLAEVAEESDEMADAAEFRRVLQGGSVDALRTADPVVVLQELYAAGSGEKDSQTPAEQRAILRDLARAGYLDQFSPTAIYTRRARTMLVDGIRYEV